MLLFKCKYAILLTKVCSVHEFFLVFANLCFKSLVHLFGSNYICGSIIFSLYLQLFL